MKNYVSQVVLGRANLAAGSFLTMAALMMAVISRWQKHNKDQIDALSYHVRLIAKSISSN